MHVDNKLRGGCERVQLGSAGAGVDWPARRAGVSVVDWMALRGRSAAPAADGLLRPTQRSRGATR